MSPSPIRTKPKPWAPSGTYCDNEGDTPDYYGFALRYRVTRDELVGSNLIGRHHEGHITGVMSRSSRSFTGNSGSEPGLTASMRVVRRACSRRSAAACSMCGWFREGNFASSQRSS
jgi:hypothetical protein